MSTSMTGSAITASPSEYQTPPSLIRRKSSNSTVHSTHSHLRIHNPFRRRRRRGSSDSGGSSSEYDPTDNVPHVAKTPDTSLTGDDFKVVVLSLLHKLAVPQWRSIPIQVASIIEIRQIYGALTNTIYQITPPDPDNEAHDKGLLPRGAAKLLLRIYGAHVEHLIDRTHELATLKRLSRHNIGPLLLGTFQNGRFEQWLDSHTLNRKEMRDANLSCSIARRMRELHDGVKLSFSERNSPPSVWTTLDKWLPRAREIIARRKRKLTGRLSHTNLPTLKSLAEAKENGITPDSWSDELILGRRWEMFELALGRYRLLMEEVYPREKLRHDLAFCHNDVFLTLQY
jgi:choline kinase